ncbi:MAG: glycosyltransferase family 9 protein [Bacteroidales bacterium]|nr:glycosyltransferase family 9 protein [Bacteroidales bacterium]
MQPVKFLVLRFSSIGDIVLTTPVIRGLKNQVENAEVHFFTKPEYKEILEANPYVDRVHILQRDLGKQLNDLKYEFYDYIIDLHKNLRTKRIISRLGIIHFTFDKLNWKKWYYVNFKVNKLPDKHIVDRYLEAVDIFDVANDKQGLDYFIPSYDQVDLSTFPSQFRDGYITFAIGAKHNTKKLTTDKIISIIEKMQLPVILLGGREDYEHGKAIALQCGGFVFNACGRYTINQSASLVRQSKLVITHDTGIMHIAAAFHKKIISIWGNTVPEFGMYPYMPDQESIIFEIRGLPCRPCSKLGFKQCPKKHFRCIMDLNDYEIAKKAIDLFPMSNE